VNGGNPPPTGEWSSHYATAEDAIADGVDPEADVSWQTHTYLYMEYGFPNIPHPKMFNFSPLEWAGW